MKGNKYTPQVWCWSFRNKSPEKYHFSDLNWGEGKDEREKTALRIGNALLGLRLEHPVILTLCTRSGDYRVVEVERIKRVDVTKGIYATTFSAPENLFDLDFNDLKIELLWALKAFCKDRFEFFAGKRTKLLEEADLLNDKVDAFEALQLSLPVFQKEMDR